VSYILDALRKSELRRRLGADPVYHAGGPQISRVGTWMAVAAIVGGIVLVGSGGVVWWQRAASVGDAVSAPTAVTTEAAAAATADTRAPDTDAESASATPLPAADTAGGRKVSKARPLAAPGATDNTPVAGDLSVAAQTIDAEDVPFLRNMPAEFQQELPPLVVNIHVYTPDESQRILYINNRQYRRGDEVDGGILVEEIVPDGVVLRYRGQHFKLPRPS
jgi:general secretion pathway protein B